MKPLQDEDRKPYLRQQVTYPLARLNAKLTAQAARLLRKHSDLSLSQWRLMVILDSWGHASLAEVIRFLDFDKGQMSRTSQGLITAGLLRSTPSETDQRVHILSLTERGRREFDRAAPHMKRRREVLLHALSVDEQAQFFHLTDKLTRAAEAFEGTI